MQFVSCGRGKGVYRYTSAFQAEVGGALPPYRTNLSRWPSSSGGGPQNRIRWRTSSTGLQINLEHNCMNRPCKVKYNAHCDKPPGQKRVVEEFPRMTEGTYSASGFHNEADAGLLMLRRLTTHGTSLVALTGPDGQQLRSTDPASFGKILQNGAWVDE